MMTTSEQAALALTDEQEPYVPTWREIAERQVAIIEDQQTRISELHFALARLIDAKIWWRCPASFAEH